MITLCVAAVLIVIFAKQFKFLLKIILNAAVGVLCINIINFLVVPGLAVGVNPLTLSVTGLLGVPGLISLYAARLIL